MNENASTSSAAAGQDKDTQPQGLKRKKPITLLPLVMLIFFSVSGGPFGTEVRLD